MSATRLTQDECERIYEKRIRPDFFAGIQGSDRPVAMFVAGQPGAGASSVSVTLRRALANATGPVLHLSEDRLRPYHPAWQAVGGAEPLRAAAFQSEIAYWFDRVVEDAQRQRMHLMAEDELRDPRTLARTAVTLRKDAYVVQAVFVHTPAEDSALATMAHYDLLRRRGMAARFVPAQEHALATANVRVAMGLLEDRRCADGIRLIDRRASELFENRLVNGNWRKNSRAHLAYDDLRAKARPAKDLVQLAMRWETLAQGLAHDPGVPREVASQALNWRNEAVARCEAGPAADLLQWAREGAAFRVMDRFEYEREFPHHARAVKLLGAAIIEAENFEPPGNTRFIASARENIAQRIERGDMARIAARERSQEPPTR